MRVFALTILMTAVVLAACGPSVSPPESADVSDDSAAAPAGKVPNHYFYLQRAGSERRIPVRARSRALETLRAQRVVVDAPGNWTNIGPFNVGGRVTALAVDPNDSQRIWLGAAAGGVFVSEDEGSSWTPVFDDQVALSIGSLAAHPTDSDTVYVGTGEDNGGGFSYDGEGVFRTTDGGQTWVDLGLAEVRRIGKLVTDPTDGDRVYVAAGGDWFNTDVHRGIYRSVDAGDSWEQVLFVADDAGGIDIVVDPDHPDRIFASIWQRQSAGTSWYLGGPASGIYRSIDGGDTWTELTNGLPLAPGRIGLAIAPSSTSVVYANIMDSGGALDGIYRSVDSGDTWNKQTDASTSFTSYSYYFSQIRVDPRNPRIVYALDQRLRKSTNSGKNFSIIAAGVHVDFHELIVETDGRFLVGCDGGFYISHDFGDAWTHAETLPITQFYDIAIDTLNPQRRFAGAQDNGTVRTTDAGLSNWTSVLGGDGLQCEVDPTDSNKVYASAQFGNIFRSEDGGDSFASATNGFGVGEKKNWNTPVTLDPSNPGTLYSGAESVYRSTDSAQSWTSISGNLTNGPAADERQQHEQRATAPGQNHLESLIRGTITVVNVSPLDPDILWAGTDDGNVWVSADGGGGWLQVNPPGLAYWVTDIAPDPFDTGTAYLTVAGYREGDSLPYVRVTDNLGASWSDISSDLPQVPVSSILADTDWRGRLFVGNDLGVWVSDDGGVSWSDMRGGIPYVVVMDLVRHDPTDTLYAGSHARSVFSFDLDQLPDADGDADGVDNNSDCALADPGAFAIPGEVTDLALGKAGSGTALLGWSSLAGQAGSGTVYQLIAGDLADLRISGTPGASALDCSVTGTNAEDSARLAPGAGRYYIVRGANTCGLGSWGTDSLGAERQSSACP